MTQTFRAKLRIPRNELWLGCVINSKREWINRNGDPGMTLGFSNCPMFATFTRRDFELSGKLPVIGDSVNVQFDWRRDKFQPEMVFVIGRIVQ